MNSGAPHEIAQRLKALRKARFTQVPRSSAPSCYLSRVLEDGRSQLDVFESGLSRWIGGPFAIRGLVACRLTHVLRLRRLGSAHSGEPRKAEADGGDQDEPCNGLVHGPRVIGSLGSL